MTAVPALRVEFLSHFDGWGVAPGRALATAHNRRRLSCENRSFHNRGMA